MRECVKMTKHSIKLHYLIVIGVSLILLSIVIANQYIKANISSWIGHYEYFEHTPPDINMHYKISIYQEQGGCYARIDIDGFQTSMKMKALISGNRDKIDIIFDSLLPESMDPFLKKGDVLVTFKKSGPDMLTYWGLIEPRPVHTDNGQVYFSRMSKS
jgi:hypothetical protein